MIVTKERAPEKQEQPEKLNAVETQAPKAMIPAPALNQTSEQRIYAEMQAAVQALDAKRLRTAITAAQRQGTMQKQLADLEAANWMIWLQQQEAAATP